MAHCVKLKERIVCGCCNQSCQGDSHLLCYKEKRDGAPSPVNLFQRVLQLKPIDDTSMLTNMSLNGLIFNALREIPDGGQTKTQIKSDVVIDRAKTIRIPQNLFDIRWKSFLS